MPGKSLNRKGLPSLICPPRKKKHSEPHKLPNHQSTYPPNMNMIPVRLCIQLNHLHVFMHKNMLTNSSRFATQQRYSNGRKEQLVANDNLHKHRWEQQKSTDQSAWVKVGSAKTGVKSSMMLTLQATKLPFG